MECKKTYIINYLICLTSIIISQGLYFLNLFIYILLNRCEGRANLLLYGNYFFTAVFAIESSIKMAAMSPRYFFAVIIPKPHILDTSTNSYPIIAA